MAFGAALVPTSGVISPARATHHFGCLGFRVALGQ